MRLTRTFQDCKFSVETLRNAGRVIEQVSQDLPEYYDLTAGSEPKYQLLELHDSRGNWALDTDIEWFSAYRSDDCTYATATCCMRENYAPDPSFKIVYSGNEYSRQTDITAIAFDRDAILRIMSVFEDVEGEARSGFAPVKSDVPQVKLRGFIGHGRAADWMELHSHLTSQHHYEVEAFERGARSGRTIQDILEQVRNDSDFAIIVMTGEDVTGDQSVRARQNVVHEAGLFQGRLGFAQTILVVEEGIELLSNFDGLQQVRFPKGSIRSAYGDVLSSLRREFGDRR